MAQREEVAASRRRRRGSGGKFLGSFLGQGVGGGAKVATTILVARILGPEGFGGYSLAVALAVGVFTVAGLSITSGATYVVARSEDRVDRAWSVLVLGWIVALAMSLTGFIVVQAVGTRRLYRIDPDGVAALRDHLDRFWTVALDAFQLAAEAAEAEARAATPLPPTPPEGEAR